ncbi:hypothetical protein RV10_GL000024 [Enterococcus pallens]|nr:hypothetical protein RV10_GL000024 [Enterococcus pallens]
MWGTLVFCNLIMAFTLSLAAKPHNHVIIENTLPPSQLDNPQVKALAKRYRKRQFQTALLLSIIETPLLLPIRDSWFMLLFFVMLFLTIGAGYGLQIRYIRKMRQLIEDNQWHLDVAPVQINTQLVRDKNVQMVSWKWFLLAGALSLGLFFLTRSFPDSLVVLLVVLFSEAIMVGGWYFVGRLPVRALTNDQEINRQYNDLTKHHWALIMVVIGMILPLTIYLPLLAVERWQNQFALLTFLEFGLLLFIVFFSLGLLLFIVFFSLGWLLALRGKQDRLLAQAKDFRYQGDDYYWRYGVYYNPNDTRFMVPDRIGLNLSVNLATQSGKILMGLVGVILMASLIITIVPMFILDYDPDPFVYTVDAQKVTLDGPFFRERAIALPNIQKLELIEKLPGKGVRTNGLATDQYAMGKFRINGKPADLLIINESKPILVIETYDRDYYFTSKRPQKTKQAYQEIRTAME